MTTSEFQTKIDYFSNQLGVEQVKRDEGFLWGYIPSNTGNLSMKKSFIYLNTLSRYNPESSNSITEQQTNFIFTQLEKLLS